MKVPVWVHEVATFFWEAAGTREPFPRSLRDPILFSPFELTIREMPALSTGLAERYLARFGSGWACGSSDRALRACLAARSGAGFILIDAADAPREKTFSLAHELAHYLWHYWRPREWAVRHLGGGAAEVFDGKRKPTAGERLRAVLANVPLGPHVHLMERGPRREFGNFGVAVAEEEADRLALELLAPAEAVWAHLQESGGPGTCSTRLVAMLEQFFGLPPSQARNYEQILWPPVPEDSFLKLFREQS